MGAGKLKISQTKYRFQICAFERDFSAIRDTHYAFAD
jgi:hypothetical protein